MKRNADGLHQRKSRLKLAPDTYVALRRQVLERDGWRCQLCGRSAELQIHHVRFRSRLGNDELNNLITLCVRCHRLQHEGIYRPSKSSDSDL
jgi:5-methylcytosine-specific restriction endonuclease McrA